MMEDRKMVIGIALVIIVFSIIGFLRCYVLIDFKIDELTYQDLGQMQMYAEIKEDCQ